MKPSRSPFVRVLVFAISFITTPLAFPQSNNCLPRPVLSLSRVTPSQMRIELVGEQGINYAVECSSNFTQWNRVATNRSSLGVTNFSYPMPAGGGQLFFRAQTVNAADGLGGSFLFDGEHFSGWDGDTNSVFRITNCAIVGGSFTRTFPDGMYLCTTQKFTNFILRLEAKLVGVSGFVNSGIQFRSRRTPGSQDVAGYQADIGPDWWGSLWDQSRRNTYLAMADQTLLSAVLRPNEWNTYVVHAEGPRIRIWINGFQTIDFTEGDTSIPRDGIIGFQVFPGAAMEVSFRRVSVEVLP